MEEIQMMIEEKIRLAAETSDAFIFEIIRSYVDSVLNVKIPKKLLERAITCFKMEHPAEFELLLNGDEGMKQKIVEENKNFHCGIEESDTKMIKTVYIDNAGTVHECEVVVFECTECKGSFQIFREENPAYCPWCGKAVSGIIEGEDK